MKELLWKVIIKIESTKKERKKESEVAQLCLTL